MSDQKVTTAEVTQLVEQYVYKALADAARYENSAPLDESGIWSLHRLAADIYSLGFRDGERVEASRNRAQRQREREAADV